MINMNLEYEALKRCLVFFCVMKSSCFEFKRYKSLKDKSKRPHHHPNEHTKEELKLIRNYKANNKETGLVVLWVKLRLAGYTRTVQGLYHVMQKMGIYKKAPSKKKESEPNEWVTGEYPGEKVQVNLKYVPKACMSPELQEMGEKNIIIFQ